MSANPKEQLLAEMDCFHCFYRFRQADSSDGQTGRYEAWLDYRAAILRRDGYRCHVCGRPQAVTHLDVRPSEVRPAGTDEMDPENLVCVCVFCEQANGALIRTRRRGVLR
ncbi:MAG: hypothetical protein PHU85_12790 [Phycisphaerae bacterium]|nr:hypothetical protein [Phycisphaerae bacterium]